MTSIKNILRSLPYILHYLAFLLYQRRRGLLEEMQQWAHVLRLPESGKTRVFFRLVRDIPEYRTLLYYRIGGPLAWFLSLYSRGQYACYIRVPRENIGTGLVLQHAHSTEILCSSMGANCQVWQNVTIGKKIAGGQLPIIGDEVKIYAGAIVAGAITIGRNATIGANAVVMKDVPANATVVGNPARIVYLNGARMNQPL